jgi:hypothetical protein
MRSLFTILTVAVLLSLIIPASAFASHGGSPAGGCPDGFHLHDMIDHDEDHEGEHVHVGSDADQNGDGFLCVKHVGDGGIHVHIDNNVPLP